MHRMKLRSMLFVPGDSERKFAKGSTSGADALILDLEDSVAPSMKAAARGHVAALLDDRAERDWRFFVRVNPFDTHMTLDDMAAVVKPGLDGLLIPKANGAQDIARIDDELGRLESDAGMEAGSVKLAVIATETPQAMFNLASYVPRHPRLVAMTWGAEDLAAAVGATDNKDANGEWTFPYQLARTQCLFCASAAEVLPLDTLYANFRDPEGLEKDCRRARRDGFVGRLAIHPDQVDIINRAFSPTPEQLADAQAIVDAFAAAPNAGTVGINGRMFDIPHLKAAMRTLAGA
jgi:citrate lyase subunit beta/citryl-CoA lyase